MFELRDYQEDMSSEGFKILEQHGFLYIAAEVRTGKTLTSLAICDRMSEVNRVLFLTKKKAIINTATPNDNDDNRMLKPITLSIDLNKLTLKCGVSLLLNLLIFNLI